MDRSISGRTRGLRTHGGHIAVVLGLLALPGCNQIYGLHETKLAPDPPELQAGSVPRNYAIFCDIERSSEPRRCATPEEVASGAFIPQSRAAVALNTRQTSHVSLDYSPDARAACGGLPQVVTYEGPYPLGTPVCVKYLDAIGPGRPYADPHAVCVAVCNDLNRASDGDTPDALQASCEANARASTNYPIDDNDVGFFGLGGYLGACTAEGVMRPDFDVDDPQQPSSIDPRRVSDPIDWDPATLVGVMVTGSGGNNLVRTAAGTGFTAGAAALQIVARGDAFLEFTATETNRRRRIGLAFGAAPNPNPGANQIDFAIDLGADGVARVNEGGTERATQPYAAGQTFRIRVTANNDAGPADAGTATITYAALLAPCPPGTPCAEHVFYTRVGATPVSYPLHVDTSFFEPGGTLTDVRIVRIK